METEEILVAIQKAADTIATPNCAAWLSAAATIGAVIVAVVVAIMQYKISKKQNEIAKEQAKISREQANISDMQNKISLLEKRMEIYGLAVISKIVAAEIIESANNNIESCRIFVLRLNKSPVIAGNLFVNERQIDPKQVRLILEKIAQAEFVFSEEIRIHMLALAGYLLEVIKLNNEENFLVYKDSLKQVIKSIEENKIMEKMRDEVLPKVEVE